MEYNTSNEGYVQISSSAYKIYFVMIQKISVTLKIVYACRTRENKTKEENKFMILDDTDSPPALTPQKFFSFSNHNGAYFVYPISSNSDSITSN